MSDKTTAEDYRQTVTSYAEEAFDRSRAGEELSDVIHELVDASCWIIYSWRARLVCQWSENEDAYFEESGFAIKASNACELWQTLAFYAMRADVADAADAISIEDHRNDGQVEGPDFVGSDTEVQS
jgi:hypothetical protein